MFKLYTRTLNPVGGCLMDVPSVVLREPVGRANNIVLALISHPIIMILYAMLRLRTMIFSVSATVNTQFPYHWKYIKTLSSKQAGWRY